MLETIVVLGILTAVSYWAYGSGKRTGSRKGYGAGRRAGRRLK